MPYAILAGALPPERMGVYMGIFNFFIVLPEILAALTFGPLVKNLLGGNLVHAVMAGGVFMLIAALLAQSVPLPQPNKTARRFNMKTTVSHRKVMTKVFYQTAALLFASVAVCLTASAAPPVVIKVEPPNWWIGHSWNPVRVLIEGRESGRSAVSAHRRGHRLARRSFPPMATGRFVDLTIARRRETRPPHADADHAGRFGFRGPF